MKYKILITIIPNVSEIRMWYKDLNVTGETKWMFYSHRENGPSVENTLGGKLYWIDEKYFNNETEYKKYLLDRN